MPPLGSDFHPPAADEAARPPDAAVSSDRLDAAPLPVKDGFEASTTRGLAALAGLVAAVIALAVVYFFIR